MNSVFAVVASYNGVRDIERCLSSLEQSRGGVRIVAVDNASTDGTADLIREKFREVTLLRLSKNLGFGRGNNVGVRYAYEQGAAHVFLLNQDAWVDPTTLPELVRLQAKYFEHGILSPLHMDGGGCQLDAGFASFISRAGDFDGLFSDLLCGRGLKEVYDVPFVNAAAWLLSRRCIETVGLFNPGFAHYGEDMEYASRVLHHGLRIGVAPGTRAFHARECRDDGVPNPGRRLLQDCALIRYRLGRFGHSTLFNVHSTLSCIVLCGTSALPWYRKLSYRLSLLWTATIELPAILRRKHVAEHAGLSFFSDAASDMRKRLVVQEGSYGSDDA